MKMLAIVACAALLTGCSTLDGMTGDEKLSLLKGASEHIQGCTRSYTLNSGFPPTSGVSIICMPVTAPPPQTLTPAQIAAMLDAAITKALEEFTAPRNR